MTVYIVLKTTAGGLLDRMPDVEASNADAAIRSSVESSRQSVAPSETEKYHAIPATRWTTIDVSSEVVQPRLTYTATTLRGLPIVVADMQTHDDV